MAGTTAGRRIVFFGSSDTGLACCRTLLDGGVPVAAIVTMPRSFRISWSPGEVNNVRFGDLAALGAERGVPVVDASAAGGRDALASEIARHQPELLVVVGWYHMIPGRVRSAARLGAVGVHASLLPCYRGGAPLVWAMIHGARRSGVSLFHLADGVDDGDVVAQADFEIGPDETIADLIERANAASAELVRAFVPRILDGTAPRQAQDHARATVMPQRKPEDGVIDWTAMSADAVHNWVRAQTRPYPGAFTALRGERLTIWRTHRPTGDRPLQGSAGTVRVSAAHGDRFYVMCGDGSAIEVIEVSRDDGVSLEGQDLVARLRLADGRDVLGFQ